MSYLLDTTVFIDHVLGIAGAPALIDRLFAGSETLFTCDIVVTEALSKGSDDETAVIGRLLDALDYVATTPAAARLAAASRRRQGGASGRGLGDALIAGVAADLGATVVTRNPRDFERLGVPVLAYGD